MSEILDNIYIWVFLVNIESVLLLALVKYMLCSHFTQNCIFCTFWSLKILVLWQKIIDNLLIFVYLLFPKNSTTNFTKTFITQEWLVVEKVARPIFELHFWCSIHWCTIYTVISMKQFWPEVPIYYYPSDYMLKRKGIEDLINKILGKGPVCFFLSMNRFHFQWEDLYMLKLNWQNRLQVGKE